MLKIVESQEGWLGIYMNIARFSSEMGQRFIGRFCEGK